MKYNLQNLRTIMDNSNIGKLNYSIYPDKNFRIETVIFIRKQANKWEIGVKDKGADYDVTQFDTEAEACHAFLERYYPEGLNGEK
ncbi:hypothetical protein [Phascolarctobacterium succinatutens]|uniref:hypothetical protein n=1 Tax=Phascolarctobacterium succinatutens TaxID=626940 RepID=UPI003AEF7336